MEPVIRTTTLTMTRLAPAGNDKAQDVNTPTPQTQGQDPISIGGISYQTIGAGGDTGAVAQNLSKLETKVNALIDYMESWVNVGNLNMLDIKQHIENHSN